MSRGGAAYDDQGKKGRHEAPLNYQRQRNTESSGSGMAKSSAPGEEFVCCADHEALLRERGDL